MRENIDHEQEVARNVNNKAEISSGNQHLFENWRKGNYCYRVVDLAINTVTFCLQPSIQFADSQIYDFSLIFVSSLKDILHFTLTIMFSKIF